MRLTAMFLLLAALQVSAKSISQIIILQEQDAPLDKVFKKIEKQSGYTFVYRDDLLKQAKKVTIDTRGASLEKVLELCFKDQPLSYSVVEKTIVVSVKENKLDNYSSALPPPVIIKGRVTDISGKPLAGVSVTINGQSKGTSTNADGDFTLAADSKDAVLLFTYIGKQTQRIPIGNSAVINVIMRDVDSQLEEVVVTGYGIKENKANQVGSAVTITAKDLERKPANRIDQLLEGLVPGVQIQFQDNSTSSARPRIETRVRGEGSVRAAGDPLWIVDGVPLYVGTETNLMPNMPTSISPLTYINPDDIESITVLKDATATTIYGASGANGVIFITTKKGSIGKDKISYGFRTGINRVTDTKFQVLNGDEYRMLVKEAAANSGKDYPFTDASDSVNTDWYDLFFRTGRTTQHNISFNGGNAKTKYFLSGSYFKQQFTMIANETERFSTRMNLDHQINKRVLLVFRMGTSYNKNKLFSPGYDYINLRPNINPYNADGSFALYDYSIPVPNGQNPPRFFNALARAYENDDNQNTFALNGTVGATIDIIKGLSFNTTNGIDFSNSTADQYSSSKNWSGRADSGYARRYQNNYLKWITINRFNYNKVFGEVHDINLVAGSEALAGSLNSISAWGSGFINDNIREVDFATEESRNGGSSKGKNTAFSLLSRASYTYDRRYSLAANFRRDGNSRFGKDVRWAKFASLGASWNPSNERFWKSGVIDFAKLKMSYGTNGNSRIGDNAKGTYDLTGIDYNGKPGAIEQDGENTVFSWEKTQMLNAGLDLGINSRITLAVEVYQNTTKDLIDNVEVSRTTGHRRIYQNVGSLRNRGIEVSINSTNIQSKDFVWETRFNISKNSNKVLSLYNNIDQAVGENIRRVGEDVKTLYLVRWAGVDPLDGRPRWYDINGNLTKTLSQALDRVPVGSATPDYYGGMTNIIRYKGLSLSALISFGVGGYAFSVLRRNSEDDGLNLASINQSKNILDRWQNPGDLALTPRLLLGESQSSSLNSSRFLHKKTNVRLSNISLNYSLPTKLSSRLKMENFSTYIQADNVAIWTPYQNKKDRNTYRNSFSPYPLEQVVSFGIVAGF